MKPGFPQAANRRIRKASFRGGRGAFRRCVSAVGTTRCGGMGPAAEDRDFGCAPGNPRGRAANPGLAHEGTPRAISLGMMASSSYDPADFTDDEVTSRRRTPKPSDFPTAILPALQNEALRAAIRLADPQEYSATTTLVGQTTVIAELRRASGLEVQQEELRSAVFTLVQRLPPVITRQAPEAEPPVRRLSSDDTVRIRIVRAPRPELSWAVRYSVGVAAIFGVVAAGWVAMHSATLNTLFSPL